MNQTGRIGRERYPIVLEMINHGKNASEIADKLSVNPETIRKFARKRGVKIVPVDQSMENHPSWKSGETLDKAGYVLKRVSVAGVYGYLIRALRKGDKRGYAPVHRIVMHDKLNRALRAGEVVDHIDGCIDNNHPDNLRVFSSNAEHLKKTLKGKKPNWSKEGFEKMCAPRPNYHRN